MMTDTTTCRYIDSMSSMLCSYYDAVYCTTATNVTIENNSHSNYGLLQKTSNHDIFCKNIIKIIKSLFTFE